MSTIAPPRTASELQPTPQQQAGALLGNVAGYIGTRTIEMGLRHGIVQALADRPGSTADDLADDLGLDGLYAGVWCRSAFASGILDREGAGFRLAPHMATLLLDEGSPAYVGGLFVVVSQPEMVGRFDANLRTGERFWWDETSPEWIAAVASTGRTFYTRLIPGGLDQVPGLTAVLEAGCRVLDTACGTGQGLLRLAAAYPKCEILGVDGDKHSVEQARRTIDAAGLGDRVSVHCSPLEELQVDHPVAVVINNISMHECRDIELVADRVKAALEPGGWFVISDFPFPDTDEGLRSAPGRIMCGIQFFEAQIDDQLLPRSAYDDLLTRHGFVDLGSFGITPVHAVTYARRQ